MNILRSMGGYRDYCVLKVNNEFRHGEQLYRLKYIAVILNFSYDSLTGEIKG